MLITLEKLSAVNYIKVLLKKKKLIQNRTMSMSTKQFDPLTNK